MTSVVLVTCHVVRLTCGIGTTIWIGRQLGNAGFGTLSSIMASIGVIMALCDFGLPSAHVVMASRHHKNPQLCTQAAIMIMTALGCFGAIAIWALSYWFTRSISYREVAPYTLVFTLPLILQAGQLYFSGLHAKGLSGQAAVIGTSIVAISSIVRISASIYGSTPGQQLMLMAAEMLIGACLGWVMIGSAMKTRIRIKRLWCISRKLVQQAFKTALQGQAETLFLKVELILLGAFGLVAVAGDYAAAMKLFEIAVQLSIYLLVPLTPRLTRLVQNHEPSVSQAFMAQSLGMLGIIGWILTIGMIGIGPLAINLLYGHSFSQSVNAVIPLGLALIPMILFQYNSRVALVMGGTKKIILALVWIGLIKGALLVAIFTLMNNVALIAVVFCLGAWALWFISAYGNEKCRDIAIYQGGGVWKWMFSSHARQRVIQWLNASRRTGDILPN
jgi:O-antigen/teichoic acid export membrane protein